LHEQQMMALTWANIFPESFENPRAQHIMTAWAANSERWKTDLLPDTNVRLFTTQGMLIASSTSVSNGSLPVDLRSVLSGDMVSTVVDGRLYTAVPARDEERSILAAFNHMTERIERMMQEQRDVIANASYELQSPLLAMQRHAAALIEQTVNSDRARQYATAINDEVSRVAQLANNLFQLARGDSLVEKETGTPPVRDP